MIRKIILSLLAVCSALSASYQTIVFDFGGVMTGASQREEIIKFLRSSLNLTDDEFEKARQERKKVQDEKTDVEFWLQYAREHNKTLPTTWVTDFQDAMKKAIGVNPEMYALVSELKEKGYKVALLSNIDYRLARIVRSFGLYDEFDPCLLSCEIGIEKPDVRIYEILLEKIGTPAKETLFIDDNEENVAAAKISGIDAIHFKSKAQLMSELNKRGIL